jgi:hypothetical protein
MVGLAITTAGVGDLLLGGEELVDGSLEIIDETAADNPAGGYYGGMVAGDFGTVSENVEIDLESVQIRNGAFKDAFIITDEDFAAGKIVEAQEDEYLRRSFSSFRSDGGMNSFGSFRL